MRGSALTDAAHLLAAPRPPRCDRALRPRMPDEHEDRLEDAGDTPMTSTYVAVLIVEAVIIALLWILGRIY